MRSPAISEARITELVEEAFQEGLSAEQACRDTPEALAEVRARLAECHRMAALLNGLFPPNAPSTSQINDSSDIDDSDKDVGDRADADAFPNLPGYRIEATMGRGGMGVVYRAVNLRLNRVVALKTLRRGMYATHAERTRFLREGRALASLRHPHVVPVYDAGELGGQPYFTMELVEGGSLSKRLAAAPLPSAEAARIVEAVGAAVQAAHDAGIIHRDLKPANVLLTTDATPKVSDFGLVQSYEEVAGDENPLTLTGQRLGTPSYMAPEQASPRWGAVGPLTDVYGIGAILYETLTGRPPFSGDSPAETERQLLSDDPVSPTRLNSRVARDLETICLKCLAKEPAHRYGSASAVVNELRRFREGLPIRARRAGRAERVVKWARRRPSVAAAAGLALLIAGASVSGVCWALLTRAAISRAATDDLRDAVAQQRQAHWDSADAATNRAVGRLTHFLAPAALRVELDSVRRNQATVRTLEALRARGAGTLRQPLSENILAADFAAAFGSAGVGDPGIPATTVAQRVQASPIRAELIAALDSWATYDTEPRLTWVLAVARLADPDPSGWRERARNPAAWASLANASVLLNDPAVSRQPTSVLLLLASRLQYNKNIQPLVIPLLQEVQSEHPDDFWANAYLGYAYGVRGLQSGDHTEMQNAARFLQAAVSLRPDYDITRTNLGTALASIGPDYYAQAISEFREAVRINPDLPIAHAHIGRLLAWQGQHVDAVREFDEGLRLKPNDVAMNVARGQSMAVLGREPEATAAFTRALSGNPKDLETLGDRKTALFHVGRLDAFCDLVRDQLLSPSTSDDTSWKGYAELCLYLDRRDDYAAARRHMLEKFGNSKNPRVQERVGRTYLLGPADGQELQRATALVKAALASDASPPTWLHPYYLFAAALADYRAANYAAVLDVCEGPSAAVLGPCPKLLCAMAHAKLGQSAAARHALAQGILRYDWTLRDPDFQDMWLYHDFRREAETLVLTNLQAFLDGQYDPQDNDERIAMTGACQAARRTVAGANLWTAVFSSNSAEAAKYRRWAIATASLAGCGQGADATSLSDPQRQAWRDQAREWLAAELAAASPAPTPSPPAPADQAATAARTNLAVLQKSPDLAPLHDPARLQKFSSEEQAAWADLWARMDAAATTKAAQ
ncbi:MAG TPA: serine/threonine-protein kinase [Humisphaera sp.]|jgi:serine/threonine-protein kinase|nr:serine/threonine-protein kinase [Humisphaera sp.]